MNDLQIETRRSHAELEERFDASAAAVLGDAQCGEVVQKTDALLIAACRHVSVMCDVILPVARRELPGGRDRAKEYVAQVRRLERSTGRAKGRLYGASQSMSLSWTQVWADLRTQLDGLFDLETRMVDDLAASGDARGGTALAARLRAEEPKGPTRPHPSSPHSGRLAHLARRVWVSADRAWDRAEARIVAGDVKVVRTRARATTKS